MWTVKRLQSVRESPFFSRLIGSLQLVQNWSEPQVTLLLDSHNGGTYEWHPRLFVVWCLHDQVTLVKEILISMSYLNTFANLITLAKTYNASAGFVLGLFHFVRNVQEHSQSYRLILYTIYWLQELYFWINWFTHLPMQTLKTVLHISNDEKTQWCKTRGSKEVLPLLVSIAVSERVLLLSVSSSSPWDLPVGQDRDSWTLW